MVATASGTIVIHGSATAILAALSVAPGAGSSTGSANAVCGTALVYLTAPAGSAAGESEFIGAKWEDTLRLEALTRGMHLDELERMTVLEAVQHNTHLDALDRFWVEPPKTRTHHA